MKKLLNRATSSIADAVSSVKGGVASGASGAATAASNASRATVGAVSSVASTAIALPAQTVSAIGDLRADTSQAILDYMFHECEASVFILHHSADAEDYQIDFDITHILEEIKDGYLVKPTLKIFVGRADIDREVLARRVTEDFMSEMDKYKEQMQETLKNGKWRNVKDLGDTVEGATSGALVTAVALGLITVITSPAILSIAAPLLLSIGLSAGVSTISDIVSLPTKLVKAGGEVVSQPFQDLGNQRELSAQEKKLLKAIKGIALVPHNSLIILASSFDNKVRPMRDKNVDTLPRENFALPGFVQINVDQVIGPYAT